MSLQQQVRLVVGVLVTISAIAGAVWPIALIGTGIVGLGLIQAGITGRCPMEHALALLPFNRGQTTQQ